LEKAFVVYTELQVEGDLLDCIYFTKGECLAQPFVKLPSKEYYKPNEEDQKSFCKNRDEFRACPRFGAFQEHLRALGLEKKQS
jgi:hypothetical protein